MNTNGNAYEEGRATRGPQQFPASGTRTKITFDPPRVPVFLRPERVPTEAVQGRSGPQYMWLFEGDQIAWFDPDFHHEICACLEVSGAAEIAITKHVRRGTPPRFEVQAVAEIPEEEAAAPPPRPAPRSAPRPPAPAVTAARRIVEVKSSLPPAKPPRYHFEEAIEAETAPPSGQLEKALIEAITAAHAASAVAMANGIKFEPTSAQFIDLAKILLKLEDQL